MLKRISVLIVLGMAIAAITAAIASAHTITNVVFNCDGTVQQFNEGFVTTPTIHASFILDGGPTVLQDDAYGNPIVTTVSPVPLTGNHSVVISDNWQDGKDPGNFGPQTFTVSCPTPPPTPCPSGYTQAPGSTSTMLLCTQTVTQTVTVYGTPVCPTGTTQTSAGQGFVVCGTTTTVFGNPSCPSGSTQTSAGPGFVVCNTTTTNTVTGPTQTVTVYGTPSCPTGSTQTSAGQGYVVCGTTTPGQTTTVYGTPSCPTGSTQTSAGQGSVVCNTIKTVTTTKKVPKIIYRTKTVVKHVQSKPKVKVVYKYKIHTVYKTKIKVVRIHPHTAKMTL